MLPRTHEAIVQAAVLRGGSTYSAGDLPDLFRGLADEDDFVVMGLRFRAPGLSHTYRPGHRFGELFATNAKKKFLRCVSKGWVGRACHLLGDMAVPARVRGVWHLLGDPFEAWLEQDVARVDALSQHIDVPEGDPADIAESLARAAAMHPADTTRTPWGKFLYGRTRNSVRLYENDIEAQARVLVPLVVAHTAALLRAVPR